MNWHRYFSYLIVAAFAFFDGAPNSSLAAEGSPGSVFVLAEPGFASPGHCIGRVDTPECATQTFYACRLLSRDDYCRRVGLPLKFDRRTGLPLAWVFTTTASFRLNVQAAAHSRGKPKAKAGWAVVDLAVQYCGGTNDPSLTCPNFGDSYRTVLFEQVPSTGDWAFVGWTDGDSRVTCLDWPYDFCRWFRYDDDWSEAWWAQRAPFQDIVVGEPKPVDLSQLVLLPPLAR